MKKYTVNLLINIFAGIILFFVALIFPRPHDVTLKVTLFFTLSFIVLIIYFFKKNKEILNEIIKSIILLFIIIPLVIALLTVLEFSVPVDIFYFIGIISIIFYLIPVIRFNNLNENLNNLVKDLINDFKYEKTAITATCFPFKINSNGSVKLY